VTPDSGFFADIAELGTSGPPDDPAARVRLAWYLRQVAADHALSLLPQAGECTGRAALVRAEVAIQAWRHDEAASLIAQAEATAGDDALVGIDALLLSAQRAAAIGQSARALELAGQATAAARDAGHREREEVAAAYAAFLSVYAAPDTTHARLKAVEEMSPGSIAQVYLALTHCMADFNRGDHGKVAHRLEPLAAEAGRLGMRQLQLRMQNTLAAAYSNLDDKDTAISWVERSIEQAREAGWPVATGEALAFLGNFYREAGQTARARETLEEARRFLASATSSRGYALACCYLAHALLDSGDYRQAAECALEGEKVARALFAFPIVIDVLTVAGRATARSGDAEGGAGLVRRALELAREKDLRVWLVDALRALAEIHADFAIAPPDEAAAADAPLFYLRKAQAEVEAMGGHSESVAILRELSRALERSGDLASALSASHAALEQVLSDESRRISNRLIAVEARHQVERQRMEADVQRKLAEAHAARADALDSANAALRRVQAELEVLASTDPMTGASNRRAFMAAAQTEMARSLRYGGRLALAICDIDHFKSINDTYGHPCGDRVIKSVALALVDGRRATDQVGRIGGEEFALLLPETDAVTALAVAERMRAAIEAQRVEWEGEAIRVTMSFGVAELEHPTGSSRDPLEALEALLRKADAALYKAKGAGRNRVAQASD
jgi:diguanylate cyclase (GGDEF)-like protein